ncbi:MAG TPA: hypothetical protein VMN39_04910 [Longimicrobiaceae bacterium]|nr:hypothetical protein [Longimicrobiaceae bacterium]
MSLREQADRRFAAAIEASGARDPRDFYRNQLKELKERDRAAYRAAAEYFEKTLIPAVADEASDPVGEWLEYGRYLASLQVDGTAVLIDVTGRAAAYRRPVPIDQLVLHLPTSTREPAIAVGIPPRLSPAQRATFDLLVRRKVTTPT